jgi:hypothetical protein
MRWFADVLPWVGATATLSPEPAGSNRCGPLISLLSGELCRFARDQGEEIMGTSLRTITALALAVPLIASTVPASASSTFMYREKGTFAEAYFEGAGTPGGLPGNYSLGWLTFHSSDLAEGFVDTFACDDGETPWGDENGENVCDWVGSFYAWGQDLTVVTGKGKGATSTYTGSVDLFDATTEEGGLAAEDVPFSVSLTPTGATSKSTFTDSFRDPETGVTYRYRETRVSGYATVEGSLDGVTAVAGSSGTYSVRSMERIP